VFDGGWFTVVVKKLEKTVLYNCNDSFNPFNISTALSFTKSRTLIVDSGLRNIPWMRIAGPWHLILGVAFVSPQQATARSMPAELERKSAKGREHAV